VGVGFSSATYRSRQWKQIRLTSKLVAQNRKPYEENQITNSAYMSEVKNKVTVKFGLSRKRHLPVIWVAGITNFRAYRLDVFLKYSGLTLTRIDDKHVAIGNKGLKFIMLEEYANIIITEFINWRRDYKFPSSLTNKTILDIGAGCGETIFYFALQGCRNFIAVEPNTQAADLLRMNGENNSLNIKVYNDIFRTSHLNELFDFIKCDCEGGESILLEQEISKPIALEVHGLDLIKKFQKKHFKKVTNPNDNSPICIMRNF
jgi:2-polyprenyl-3-methyl-5-hydroxy-6-metoxy-1,4-benzoquinol methylase